MVKGKFHSIEEYSAILHWYSQMGVDNIVIDERSYRQPSKIDKKVVMPLRSASTSNESVQSSKQIAAACVDLTQLENAVKSFEGCVLKKTATNVVFSEGVKDSEVMFMGEAPGSQEDKFGRPFCGDSGKLLDLMLKSIGLDRTKNCYITNSIFWRPPANRKPTSEEIEICRPFVEKHIELFAPKLLVLVGSTAAETVLNVKTPMSQLRRKILPYSHPVLKEVRTVAIFHPAYLLRQPLQKKEMWLDLLFIKQLLEDCET